MVADLGSSSHQFSDFVRQYCAKNQISLEGLAKLAGISRGTLYGLLREGGDAKVLQWIKLANAMGVHYTLLLQLKYGNLAVPGESAMDGFDHDVCGFIDETVPDGTIVMAGHQFVKTWTLQNLGGQVWEERWLMCMDEPVYTAHTSMLDNFGELYQLKPHATQIAIPTTQPKQCITLAVTFVAPKVSGRYISYWKMIDKHGELCFPNNLGLSVNVSVKGLGVAYRI